jgi:hypothetical protein
MTRMTSRDIAPAVKEVAAEVADEEECTEVWDDWQFGDGMPAALMSPRQADDP